MSIFHTAKHSILLMGGIALLTSVAWAETAQARDFSRTKTVEGSKGRTATVNDFMKANRGEGYERNRTLTTPKGENYNRNIKGQYDQDNKILNRTVTNNKGEQHTTQTAYDRETRTSSSTSSRGGSAQTTYGNGTATTTYTTPGGKTGTVTRQRKYND